LSNITSLVEILADLIKSIGMLKASISILLLILFVTSTKFITHLIKYFFNKKEKEKQLKTKKEIQHLIDKFFKNTNKYIKKIDENNELFSCILEKLQVSTSKEKFKILTETFVGLNRDFSSATKTKLFGYLELNKYDNFIHIRNEIKNLFIEKVINRLQSFIIYDETFSQSIKEKCMLSIDSFLDSFEEMIKQEDKTINDIKKFIESEKGIYKLIVNLVTIIDTEYIKILYMDDSLHFLKE